MNKNILIILFASIIGAQGINSNINSYKTNVILRPSDENIEVIAFVEIFNRNLQFLKKDINCNPQISQLLMLQTIVVYPCLFFPG